MHVRDAALPGPGDMTDGIVRGDDGVRRCWWGDSAPSPNTARTTTRSGGARWRTTRLFEKLSLEGFQAGLSWLTILRKREAFRRAFAAFEPEARRGSTSATSPGYSATPRSSATAARSRRSSTTPAARPSWSRRRVRSGASSGASNRPPDAASTGERAWSRPPDSRALARELRRRGWRFVGPTTVYAFMQAMGLVNDHLGRVRGARPGDSRAQGVSRSGVLERGGRLRRSRRPRSPRAAPPGQPAAPRARRSLRDPADGDQQRRQPVDVREKMKTIPRPGWSTRRARS